MYRFDVLILSELIAKQYFRILCSQFGGGGSSWCLCRYGGNHKRRSMANSLGFIFYLVQESLCLLMQIVVSAEQCHKNKRSLLFCNVCFLFLRMLETSYRGMPKVASHTGNSFKFPIIIANAHAWYESWYSQVPGCSWIAQLLYCFILGTLLLHLCSFHRRVMLIHVSSPPHLICRRQWACVRVPVARARSFFRPKTIGISLRFASAVSAAPPLLSHDRYLWPRCTRKTRKGVPRWDEWRWMCVSACSSASCSTISAIPSSWIIKKDTGRWIFIGGARCLPVLRLPGDGIRRPSWALLWASFLS